MRSRRRDRHPRLLVLRARYRAVLRPRVGRVRERSARADRPDAHEGPCSHVRQARATQPSSTSGGELQEHGGHRARRPGRRVDRTSPAPDAQPTATAARRKRDSARDAWGSCDRQPTSGSCERQPSLRAGSSPEVSHSTGMRSSRESRPECVEKHRHGFQAASAERHYRPRPRPKFMTAGAATAKSSPPEAGFSPVRSSLTWLVGRRCWE